MAHDFSARYGDLINGSYDCVGRVVLNAWFPMGVNPGGLRTWWRRLHGGSDDQLDDTHLMRMAGRFARRVKAWAAANGVPVIFCKAGERKHLIAEEYLETHVVTTGVFLILAAKAPAAVWKVSRSARGVIANIEKKREYVYHYSFHITDPAFGHLTIKMSGHPPFGAQVMLNGQYAERPAMGRRGHGVVTRSAVYRVLVRNQLIEPRSRRRRRQDYIRWERPVPMQLWQLDVTASAFLTDGTEVKIVTGLDDHSRYCVIAQAVMRATARPVCRAFVEAMAVYGGPEEVLTDNGTVFTGRFLKPRPAEVLFERSCRENGITRRLTKPRSPTTTGKIERLHQSLQDELLDVHGPFASLAALQAALDAWRQEYNTGRPHQSLDMAFPASRFAPAVSPLPLRVPPQLATASAQQPEQPEPSSAGLPAAGQEAPLVAVEADRVVPPSGNLWVGGQQVWLGPALADKKVTIWVDETSLHVLLDGARIKTLPSRLGAAELARLAAAGRCGPGPARPWRWSVRSTPPAWSAWRAPRSTWATSWPGSASSCGWTAPRWPSSPATGNWRGPCPARFPPVTGTGCAAPAGPRPVRSRRPGR